MPHLAPSRNPPWAGSAGRLRRGRFTFRSRPGVPTIRPLVALTSQAFAAEPAAATPAKKVKGEGKPVPAEKPAKQGALRAWATVGLRPARSRA